MEKLFSSNGKIKSISGTIYEWIEVTREALKKNLERALKQNIISKKIIIFLNKNTIMKTTFNKKHLSFKCNIKETTTQRIQI